MLGVGEEGSCHRAKNFIAFMFLTMEGGGMVGFRQIAFGDEG